MHAHGRHAFSALHCIHFGDMLPCFNTFVMHSQAFMESLYSTLRKSIPYDLLTIETAFALRAVFLDSTTPNILGLSASSRPGRSASLVFDGVSHSHH